ncbi:conserved Plasmodium protein, unknown function [Plasmodium relictum]|uniref:Uncharacterized protein n=1 Tax=Plasmodium relictum TaxID=85471 RepID=A0A1J1HA18_PLARL|nr:conserved Plasmodium protein, unknown function [Plasmodium relictum]CRH01789.1 conserved Plasmodium protein, unknown function [Plasmodium relictum]
MSLKNKMHVNELNETLFDENYKIKGNTTEVELMETIENFSDDLVSNNGSFDSNQSINISSKKGSEKGNEKSKKDNFKCNRKKNVLNSNKKNENSYSNIPQIYETHDSNAKEEFHSENSKENQNEKNIFSNVLAILYIIIAIVIILHLYLNEDHIIIKTITILKLKFVDLIKRIPIFKNLMKTVTLTNNKINSFLDNTIAKSDLIRPYMEALKQLNTEFSILFIILIITFFTATIILHIMYGLMTMKQEKDNAEKENVVLVTNKMTVEEYEDKSFTYSELAKLHEDKDYICLKNKRAGEGIESWNWQVRKFKNEKNDNNDYDICSDIELSDTDEI